MFLGIVITTLLSVKRISMSLAVMRSFKASMHQMTLFAANKVEQSRVYSRVLAQLDQHTWRPNKVLTACDTESTD